MGNKKALVPRLRFPEFRDAVEWDKCSLGQLAKLYKGKGISKSDINPNGSQPCIRYGELYTLYGEVIDKVVSKTDLSPSDLFLSCEDDVIIPSSGETKIDIATAACVKHKNIALGGDLNVIRSNHNGDFLSYQLNGTLRHEIAKVAQGDTVAHLYKSNLEKLALALPSPEEQQKIAKCLSSIDALIAAHTEKTDVLKTHKKGLMQQLFPLEGETVPRLRFPEFRNTGEWKTGIVKDLISTVTPPKKLTSDLYENEGRFPVVDQSKEDICGWTNDEDALVSIDSTLIVFGDHTCILKILYKPFVQGADGIKILKTTEVIEPAFLYQHLLFSPVKMESYKRHFSTLKEKRILYPDKGTGEQQRIADCLFSLDELIAAQVEKLDVLKTHKRGLMQQLFPSPEAVGV